ncbi:MAG TPA: efflux RND transporter periplasmic adaptor subunit [Candidatus Acidoferrales bacterium]|nr:efflux RND transporter periplasmic adaptor subunit [Candidatus Acidoferrales bacterium]
MPAETEIDSPREESYRSSPQITPPPELPAAPARKALFIVAIVVVILAVGGAASMLSRIRAGRALAKETDADSIATVVVVHPVAEKPDEELVLPASLQAYEESPIYARTNGYLLKWYKDIGSRVTQGELLADIDTPEVDQELSQARATRQQSAAQLDIAKISADRWQNLRKTDSVSQQETDTQTNAYQQAVANLAAADANVRRLEQLESFKHVYAPFSGILIKRNVDPGALINAGSSGTELFIIAKVDPLRVFTNVPQAYSPAITTGMQAYITLPEIAGEKFRGTVARTADAIDPATRTLLTEVDVPNKDGRLLRGSFGEVHFAPKINTAKVTVPVNAMLFRQEGAQLAVVGPDNKVQLRPITIGRDYGTNLEILGGVSVEDRIIINPSDSLEDGQKVNVAGENQEGQRP